MEHVGHVLVFFPCLSDADEQLNIVMEYAACGSFGGILKVGPIYAIVMLFVQISQL